MLGCVTEFQKLFRSVTKLVSKSSNFTAGHLFTTNACFTHSLDNSYSTKTEEGHSYLPCGVQKQVLKKYLFVVLNLVPSGRIFDKKGLLRGLLRRWSGVDLNHRGSYPKWFVPRLFHIQSVVKPLWFMTFMAQ